ncbi:hypothetical protein ACOAKC_09650 [Hathewaya histolytica]|uniref:hypothetical protein n=1 Tax=Hathewaya histolytica TaxID=1498 RepID=UPI003B6707EC
MKVSKKKLRVKRTLILLIISISILLTLQWAFSRLFSTILKDIRIFKQDNDSTTFISEKEQLILNQYNTMLKENKDGIEIIKFINKNIDIFSKNNAGKLLTSYEEYQISKLDSINKYLKSENNISTLSSEVGKDPTENKIKSLSNPNLKDYLKPLYESGYRIIYSNSTYACVVNYKFYESYNDKINSDIRDYFTLMNNDQNISNTIQNSDKINWNDISNLLLKIDNQLNKNRNSDKDKKVKEMYSEYIRLYTLGSSRFPTFDKNNILLKEVQSSYESVIENNKDSRLSYTLKGLIDILSENNYALNNQVEDYVLSAIRDILQQ